MTSMGPRNLEITKEVIDPKISHEENSKLIVIPTEYEIKDYVFNLGPLKSPGTAILQNSTNICG